jgi:antitoxin HigA-1
MNMHNPPHPGEVIKDLIENSNISITEAAKVLDVSRTSLSKLVNCRGGISPEMAIRLSIALKTSSEMWLNLQAAYDLWNAEKNRQKISKKVQVLEDYIEKHQSAA